MSDSAPASAMRCESHRGRLRELHGEAPGAQIAPKLLPEQHLDIRFVVDHENKHVHVCTPDLFNDAPARGRTILNSVKRPVSDSTAIVPACCFTMMS